MEAEARDRLQEYFAPYNERLRAFWGRTEFPWETPG
jgi:N-formylglutamate amidohydrolase